MLEKVKKYYQLKKYNKAEIIARRELKKSPGILEYYYLELKTMESHGSLSLIIKMFHQ